MRGKSTKPPSYRLHKASGQAVVTIDGRDVYLGPWQSPESRLRYERAISAWMAGKDAPAPQAAPEDCTVAELCLFYLREAEQRYQKNGKATSELVNVKRAIRCLRELYADLPAKQFSPLKLKACRDKLIKDGLCRTNVTRYQSIITRIVAFGVENELIPGEVHHALEAVKPLQAGRSAARETGPVGPVDDETVEATLAHLSEPYASMVRLQSLTGMRPGEVIGMTGAEIDRSGPVWTFRPKSFKTQHHKGRSRVIGIGPKGQMVLRPFLDATMPEVLLFRNRRRTRINRNSYEHAIRTAARKAGVPSWTPNQLRYSFATKVRASHDLESAQTVLGHSTPNMTLTYAERDLAKVMRIMAEVG